MQMVIDISEEDYEALQRKDKFNDMFLNYYEKLIIHGTPLPKGHGRLIDADAFNAELNNCDYDTYNDYSNTFDWIEEAQTIIEADKQEGKK